MRALHYTHYFWLSLLFVNSFTTSVMRSLCSCNGSKGSCGIAQQEGFLPVSCDGEGFCQWSAENGRRPVVRCGQEQDRAGEDDLTVFELREEHHVAGITVLWRFDLDVDSVCCFLIVASIYKHPFNAHLLGQPRQVVDDLIRKHCANQNQAVPGFGWRNAFGSNYPCTLPSKETHTEVWISFEWGLQSEPLWHRVRESYILLWKEWPELV